MDSIQEGGTISMWKRKRPRLGQLAVNVSEETRRRIQEEAEMEDISISSWIGRAINRYFELENNSRKEKMSWKG